MASVVPHAEPLLTMRAAPNIVEEEETAANAPLVSKRRRKRANEETNVNTSRKVLRKDFDVSHPTQSTIGGKYLAFIRLGASSIVPAPASQETLAGTINPDPISFVKPSSVPEQDIAQSSKIATAAGGPEPDPTSPTIVMSPGGIYQPEWGVTNGCRLDTPSSCQELVDHLAPPGYFSELRHLPNEEFLGQFNITLARQVAMGSQLRLRFEQEAKLLRKSITQVARRDQKIQAMKGEKKNLETLLEAEADMRKDAEAKNAELVTGEEKIKAAFEEFKKYEDEQVSARCAETDSRLDALSIDFDEELYPHMLTAIVGRRWDLKYPFIDEMEKLRDAPMDVLMTSLYLESDTRADAPQWICDLRPSLLQLKIPVYPKVRDPQDPWAVKEEMLLEDAIAGNVSRAEKKKKYRIVCRTYGVGSAHHARSDGVPVSVPTAVPQGLAILLVDAATQTDVSNEESSPKITRSKSLPSM
ncbi:hypothetical protein Tco_1318162 [Tanacetum coccineum]